MFLAMRDTQGVIIILLASPPLYPIQLIFDSLSFAHYFSFLVSTLHLFTLELLQKSLSSFTAYHFPGNSFKKFFREIISSKTIDTDGVVFILWILKTFLFSLKAEFLSKHQHHQHHEPGTLLSRGAFRYIVGCLAVAWSLPTRFWWHYQSPTCHYQKHPLDTATVPREQGGGNHTHFRNTGSDPHFSNCL